MVPQPYYNKYFLSTLLATVISFILLFLPPRRTTGGNSHTISTHSSQETTEQPLTQDTQPNAGSTTTQPVKNNTQTIVLMGDIMLSRSIGAWNKKEGYTRSFALLSGETTDAAHFFNPVLTIPECKENRCIILGNLESPFSTSDLDKHERTMRFKANTGNIAFLNTLRADNSLILTLANNHINNAGGAGIVTTSDILDKHNILHVGAGSSQEEASRILTFSQNNIHRCIAGYSYDGNGGRYGGKPLYRNPVTMSGMLADLSVMKTQLRCDIKAMMIHRGAEYHINPNKTQIKQAHTLIDNGLDIVLGSHAHIPGKIEVYSGKYIFYSLGNAMFDQDRGKTAGSPAGMDSIYDDILKKNAVPTYIALFPELFVEKKCSNVYTGEIDLCEPEKTNTTISLKQIHGTRIEKGVYTGLDSKTLDNILEKIFPQEEHSDI